MACGKTLFYVVAILASTNLILAQEGSGDSGPPEEHGPPNDKNSPGFGSFGGFANIPGFGFFPGFMSSFQGFFPLFGAATSTTPASDFDTTTAAMEYRRKRSLEDDEEGPNDESDNTDNDDDDSPQSRFFFSSLFNTRLVTCNYTTQAGNTCASCRQVLTCFSSNVGKLRPCKKFFPYCNNGRCSLFRGPACYPTTTASATTTTTAATTTTTSADATTATVTG